ncbi:hypothetical protein [Paenibacillus sp. YPG26]|uniref:hypothetical protein n=1 Tax=Paenibacillus sp. YPG26 TaxID=2878915 RepID=UPI00203BBB28|nr:hypothetical protein [Paenibacillus sp. YPG26]USB32969.1 hypothetical protein LDO05_17245 [Paenibacillus sp. YPG26]
MEYAFAVLAVIGVIFLVIFNIRTSRRVREQQRRSGQISGTGAQDSEGTAAQSDHALRPEAGDPDGADPTVMQINEILEPVSPGKQQDITELNAQAAPPAEQGDRAGTAVDRVLSSTGTTSRDEHYRQALRRMAEPEQAEKPLIEGSDDNRDDAGDKAYREALRSILERKSADHSERGSGNE